MSAFQFENPSDNPLDKVLKKFLSMLLAVYISAWVYASLGFSVRTRFGISYYNVDTIYDTVLSRLVQDAGIGVLSLVTLGLIPAVIALIWFWYDLFSFKQNVT
jgi:hypothetical protein